MDNPWFSGKADVLTFTLNELLGTKLRALYQRRKGRDLFDHFEANLTAKLAHRGFRRDLAQLVVEIPAGYSIDVAGTLVRERLLTLLG